MSFLEFKDKLFDLACFNIHQVYAWQPGFDRNSLTRWVNKGYLLRLRQGYFTFADYRGKPGYPLYFANRIYQPSYVSLHTALAFYGMIPEAVVQVTSVTSLKPASFSNAFGDYSYHSIKESLMFGYELKPVTGNRTIRLASPEKALLDLLYLYPFYNNAQELEALRLDDAFLHNDLNKALLTAYCAKFQSKALSRRVNLLFNVYDV
jgi:predicted transcriptional regulator of viral defense system